MVVESGTADRAIESVSDGGAFNAAGRVGAVDSVMEARGAAGPASEDSGFAGSSGAADSGSIAPDNPVRGIYAASAYADLSIEARGINWEPDIAETITTIPRISAD